MRDNFVASFEYIINERKLLLPALHIYITNERQLLQPALHIELVRDNGYSQFTIGAYIINESQLLIRKNCVQSYYIILH